MLWFFYLLNMAMCHKILMAPDMQLYNIKYWRTVAMAIVNNTGSNHTLMMLTHNERHNFTKVPNYTPIEIKTTGGRLSQL